VCIPAVRGVLLHRCYSGPRDNCLIFSASSRAAPHNVNWCWGVRVMALKSSFICPHCNAMYQVIRQGAGPETVYSEITCRACGGPLPNREGKYVHKYFLLRKGVRDKRWQRAGK
jgi:hypothetical protein